MKYPIGIQTFEKIRKEDFAYVDKTSLMYELAQNLTYVLLSRPRRFGKSLLLSTLEAYFSGKKELFEGLAVYNLEKEWIQHPVLHLDMNGGEYDSIEGLESVLDNALEKWEALYGKNESEQTYALRFGGVISRARQLTGKRVVILIDEYDKPLLEAVGNDKLQETYRKKLKPIYAMLKKCDADIRFAMLSGITKMGHLSIFSDINNLNDISMTPRYATICGITKQELFDNFNQELISLAHIYNETTEEMINRLIEMYDGYRFCEADERVFNPFSLLCAFSTEKNSNYWFRTGTPTFLVKLLQTLDYQLTSLEGKQVSEATLESFDSDSPTPVALIFQSGYLTIDKYDTESELFTLKYPNREVRQGFLDFLLPLYTGIKPDETSFVINEFIEDVNNCRIDAFMQRLHSLFADTPYSRNKDFEYYYQDILYTVFRLMGFRVHTEYHTARGRIDFVVKTSKYIYVMEFKVDSSATEAMEQIKKLGYIDPFMSDPREKILIGVNFDSSSRNISLPPEIEILK